MKKRVVVVGGGAAGMMAALAAAQNGSQVTVFEKNEKLGKKIYITGKGRCNVTNACSAESFFENVVTNPRFLYSSFYGYDNQAVCSFLEQEGCRLKTERGDRVFPVSDHASDVTRALEQGLRKNGVKVCLNTPVKEILTENDRVAGVMLSDGTKAAADAVILATGGLSYPTTGSNGDGLRMAKELGHSLIECAPSLVPLETKESWCMQLQGLALKNVSVSMKLNGKEIYSGFGEMLFTHFGISGPLILSASSYYSAALAALKKKVEKKKGSAPETDCVLYLNLKPALTAEQLDKRLLRDFDENKNKHFRNVLDGLFPSRLIPVMIELSGIDPEKKVNEISREERKKFAALIQSLPITVTGTRDYREAIITRGGVKVQEVNPSTMESKKISGLYFAGEMLDVDALTGGFNLQIAWSTGHLAGESAAAGN